MHKTKGMNEVYSARRTVCSMLAIRGYTVDPAYSLQTPEQVVALYVHNPARLTVVAQGPDGSLIAALFHVHCGKRKEKLGVGCVRQYAKILHRMSIFKAILVSHGLTPLASRELTHHMVHMEPFLFRELVVNILEHKLVPKHEPLEGAERKAFMQKYRLEDLPLILHTDPVVRFLGLKDGDVVKITRPDFVAGLYVTYRRVVSTLSSKSDIPSDKGGDE